MHTHYTPEIGSPQPNPRTWTLVGWRDANTGAPTQEPPATQPPHYHAGIYLGPDLEGREPVYRRVAK